MSLLEKAIRGTASKDEPKRTSLFSRAMAAQAVLAPKEAPFEEVLSPPSIPEFPLDRIDELERRLVSLPPAYDSVLALWSSVSESMRLSASALFLPRGDFLSPAALNGFPSGTIDEIPMSLALSSRRGAEPLVKEAKALLAPILGVPLSLSLRAAAMRPESGFIGLWVYHDASIDASPARTQERIGSLLAHAGDSLPPTAIAIPVSDPTRDLLEASRKYPSASAFSFFVESPDGKEDRRFQGLAPSAIRSAFLSACLRILSKGGAARAYGDRSIGCVLGSASPIDPGLALFQFKKTLRRILPFLASGPFPEGRALGFDPSSELAREDLSRFFSR